MPSPETTACIQLERCEDGVWEFAVWLGARQLVLGHRKTQEDAYRDACKRLIDAEMPTVKEQP